MESILEEFDQLHIEDSQSRATENAMMVKGSKGKGKKKKNTTHPSGNSTNPDIECWNCSEREIHLPQETQKETNQQEGEKSGGTYKSSARRLCLLLQQGWGIFVKDD